ANPKRLVGPDDEAGHERSGAERHQRPDDDQETDDVVAEEEPQALPDGADSDAGRVRSAAAERPRDAPDERGRGDEGDDVDGQDRGGGDDDDQRAGHEWRDDLHRG